MGYNVELSINMLKETKFSEIESNIRSTASLYGCSSIYSISEEDGIAKIPHYNYVFIIHFMKSDLEEFIKFIKYIKSYRRSYIDCIYDNDLYKLIYASRYYLKNVEKDVSQKYKDFIGSKKFTENEVLLLNELL